MESRSGLPHRLPFAYYDKLSAEDQRIYRKSDAITRIAIAEIGALMPLAAGVEPALAAARRAAVERSCQALVDALNRQLATPPVQVRVLERRPSNSQGELQGLYEPDEVTGGTARITVWMRTAQRGRGEVRLSAPPHHEPATTLYDTSRPDTFHTEASMRASRR